MTAALYFGAGVVMGIILFFIICAAVDTDE